jgi:hypothetical protein
MSFENLLFKYGVDEINSIDVTHIVLEKCIDSHGNISIQSSKNQLFGDPFFGIPKKLLCLQFQNLIKQVEENNNFYFTDKNMDPFFYRLCNQDLVHMNDNELLEHFLIHGRFENRLIINQDSFFNHFNLDVEYYRKMNSDINQMNDWELITHYYKSGRYENRICNNIKKDYNMKVVLFVNARDENNLPEWVAHHLLLGFDFIYIFDHKSKIPIQNYFTKEKYQEKIFVERIELDGAIKNILIKRAVEIAKEKKYDWMLYLDADEFLTLNCEQNVKEFLSIYPDADSLSLNWLMFGTNFHVKEPKGLIINNYNRSDLFLNNLLKTFVRPVCANLSKITPHRINIMNNYKAYHISGVVLGDNLLYDNHFTYNVPYYLSKSYIAHYFNQSEENYYDRKLNVPRDDTGHNRYLGTHCGDHISELHKDFNEVINTTLCDKYAKNICEFLEIDYSPPNNIIIQPKELQYYYGPSFHDNQVVNITSILLEKCLQEDGSLKMVEHPNNLFGDPFYGIVKYLFIVYQDKVFKKVAEGEKLYFSNTI